MKILGISGSLRRGSHNLTLLRAAAAQLPPNAEFEEWRGLADLPAYDEDLDATSTPAAVGSLRQAIAHADALIIATPEYNGSVPGALKNALDWASRPWPDNSLRGKPVSVIGASTGLFGAVWAQAEVRKILTTVGADVLDRDLPVGQAHQAFDAHGGLADPELGAQLGDIVAELLTHAAPRGGSGSRATTSAGSLATAPAQGPDPPLPTTQPSQTRSHSGSLTARQVASPVARG